MLECGGGAIVNVANDLLDPAYDPVQLKTS
jgi:hypothetical protein